MTVHPAAFIHPFAHVDDSVTIGARTRVWQFASVIRGTVLGEDCNVASNVTLDGPIFGDRCIVSPGVDIGPGFRIGNDVFLGPNVVLCNDAWPTVDKAGWDIEAFRAGMVTVRVESGASIGANAVILPGVVIGERAVVAAGAVVGRNVPADHLFRRDGSIVPVKPVGERKRMREAWAWLEDGDCPNDDDCHDVMGAKQV